MKADTIRTYRTVHTWAGIVAGMALFIAFYAGALTMFKEPIARWATPPRAAGAGVDAVPLADAPALIARTLAERPAAAAGFWIHLQPSEQLAGRLTWHEDDRGPNAPPPDHDHSHELHYAATLDAAGALRVHPAQPSELPRFIDTLHRVVGLPADTDEFRWVMGVVAVLYAVALISGVIVLLPTLVSDFFALRLGKNLKRMWLDSHNVAGIVSLPFHLLMAVTAGVFAFHDGIYALQDALLHEGKLQTVWRAGGGAKPPKPEPRTPAQMLAPAELLQRVQAIAPDFRPTGLQYARVDGPRANVRVWGRDDGGIARAARGGFAVLDPYTGRITDTGYLPGHQGPAKATVTSFFTLHFGSFGGPATVWLYFLLGLAGAYVFYSGNLLWIESRRKSAARAQAGPVPQKRSARWMAAATVGVCLGCVCGLSATIAAAKLLHGQVADLDAWHVGVYYAVFFAAIGWAVVAGAARASVQLLWAAAAATAAIPAASLFGALWPAGGLWAHGSAGTVGVDLVAAAGALCFAAMARATQRRVRDGRADSVWSAAPQPPDLTGSAARADAAQDPVTQ